MTVSALAFCVRCPPAIVSAEMVESNQMCWFPMRVTYGRECAVKTFLDAEGIENFLPMTTKVSRVGRRIVKKRVPALSNLIFVHHTMQQLTLLKQTRLEAEPLRYMVRRALSGDTADNDIIIVPDRQMDNFLRVAAGPEDEYTYLSPDEMTGHEHGRVKVVSGPFAGVEGIIKRIHGNKQVVVELEGLGGITINFIPKNFIMANDR